MLLDRDLFNDMGPFDDFLFIITFLTCSPYIASTARRSLIAFRRQCKGLSVVWSWIKIKCRRLLPRRRLRFPSWRAGSNNGEKDSTEARALLDRLAELPSTPPFN